MKNNRNFTLVLSGQAISLFGSSIQRFSLSLYLLELTGSAALYSNILAISILPYIFLAPAAGMTADIFNRKKIMIILDLISFGLLLGYGICFSAGIESALLAGSVMILLSAISTFYQPAVTACLPQILKPERLHLANSYVSQVGAFSNIAGPVLAGILYGLLGIRIIVLLNAFSFLLSAGLECLIHMPDPERKNRRRLHLLSSYIHMGHTFRILRKNYAIVAGIILSYGLYNLCIVPVNSVLFPAVMNLELGISSKTYGIVEGFITCGMLLSGLMISRFPGRFRFAFIYRYNYPMPVMLCIMGITLLSSPKPFYMILLLTLGGMTIMFCLGIGNIVTLTFMQNAVPTDMLGSVSALSTAVATATIPFGQILFGHLMDTRLNTGYILLLSSAAAALVCQYVRYNIRGSHL